MTSSDFLRPVESIPNITAATPMQRQEDGKKKQDQQKNKKQQQKKKTPAPENLSGGQKDSNSKTEPGKLDFKA